MEYANLNWLNGKFRGHDIDPSELVFQPDNPQESRGGPFVWDDLLKLEAPKKDDFMDGLSDIEGSFFGEKRDSGIEPYEELVIIQQAGQLVACTPSVQVPLTAPQTLPTGSQDRKDIPMARGLMDYFPAALAEVARLSMEGNRKHNPGTELHWSRDKSTDHADCIMRHLVERGEVDTDGFLHDVKVAWRALAQLQVELEKRGAPKARGAK